MTEPHPMTKPAHHTASEMLAVLSARQLRDGQVVFAGVGIPLLAATLAQRLHCPGLTILFEGGVIGAFVEPGKLPPSTNDQRCTKRANMVLGSADVLLLLQRGYVDVGFMGGAQIDQFGNLNSLVHRRSGAAEDPAARHRRRQRHLQPDEHDRGDEAREAPVRRQRRFHHQPGLHPRRHQPRRKRAAGGRDVPRGHRTRRLLVRRRGTPHEGAGAQPRRQPRAGAGQHRLRPGVRRHRFGHRTARAKPSWPRCGCSTRTACSSPDRGSLQETP